MFPSVLNTFNIPNPTDRLNSPSHSELHNTVSSALGQVQAVIGVEGLSSVVGTFQYLVKSPGSDGGGHVQTANKGGTGQTTYTRGDLLVAQSASVLTKLAAGNDGEVPVANSSVASGIQWGQPNGTQTYLMGASSPTYAKTYHNFQLPTIGTSAAAVVGAWTAGSVDVGFSAGGMIWAGTGSDRFYMNQNFMTPFGADGSGMYFDDNKVMIMDYFARLPVSSVVTMTGFVDGSASNTMSIIYNQTAQEAVCFTTYNSSVYAHTSSGSAATTTQITGVNPASVHGYRIVADLNANTAQFYVDGVLKVTNSTNFPTANAIVGLIAGRTDTGAGSYSIPNFAVSTT